MIICFISTVHTLKPWDCANGVLSGSWSFLGIRASCMHTCRRYLQQDKHQWSEGVVVHRWQNSYLRRKWAPPPPSPWCRTRRSASCHSVCRSSWPSPPCTRPWPAARRSLPQSTITTGVRGGDGVLSGSLLPALTGYEEEDAGCEGLVKPVERGVVDEGHDADDDADETSQEGEDHEGPGGIPVGCVCVWGGGQPWENRTVQKTTVGVGGEVHRLTALTDAVGVRHAFPRHAVPPQALVHVIAGVAVLHPIVRRRRDNEEYVPHSCAEQPTSHEAVHPGKRGGSKFNLSPMLQSRSGPFGSSVAN